MYHSSTQKSRHAIDCTVVLYVAVPRRQSSSLHELDNRVEKSEEMAFFFFFNALRSRPEVLYDAIDRNAADGTVVPSCLKKKKRPATSTNNINNG